MRALAAHVCSRCSWRPLRGPLYWNTPCHAIRHATDIKRGLGATPRLGYFQVVASGFTATLSWLMQINTHPRTRRCHRNGVCRAPTVHDSRGAGERSHAGDIHMQETRAWTRAALKGPALSFMRLAQSAMERPARTAVDARRPSPDSAARSSGKLACSSTAPASPSSVCREGGKGGGGKGGREAIPRRARREVALGSVRRETGRAHPLSDDHLCAAATAAAAAP